MATIQNIKCEQIQAGNNDRTVFNHVALLELADSIQQHGLAQPITVRAVNSHYEIVAGERRFRAIAQILNLAEIPAIVRELTDEQAAAIMLSENTARQDLDAIDEAGAYQKNMTRFHWSIEETAKNAGVSTQRVHARLKLLNLREDLQNLVRTGDLLMGYAQIIAHAELDTNRQIIALRDLRENPRPTPSWFRRVVNELKEQQAQSCMFDLELLTVQDANNAEVKEIELPPHPTTHNAPKAGSTIVEVCRRQAGFWRKAAAAWQNLGHAHKRQECAAAAIASGEKREEYREIKRYWETRIEGRDYDEVWFRNGYSPDASFMRVEYHGWRFGEWQGRRVYALQLGKILEIRNYEGKEIIVKAQQLSMFTQGEDLPLFSGTAQRARSEQFKPQEILGRQLHLGGCPICEDTGIVYLHPGPNGEKFCNCEAGDQARADSVASC